MNDDVWFNRYMDQQKVVDELINTNSKMRQASLLIADHKLPYKSFSLNQGSNGVRDHFINIAKESLSYD